MLRQLIISILFISSILLSACGAPNEPINENHRKYIETFDWTVKKTTKRESIIKSQIYNETLITYSLAGLDLTNVKGEETIEISSYLLREECLIDGDQLEISAVIFDRHSELLGGYLAVEGFTPGVIKLDKVSKVLKNLNCHSMN